MRRLPPFVTAVLAFLIAPASAWAVSIGMVDDFADGTTMGWVTGNVNPNPPTNSATGGPAGAGDAFLLLQSNGQAFAGGRLTAFNAAQWAGDYTAAGVLGIAMAVNNFGPTDLYLRLLFEDFGAGVGPPTHSALTADAVLVRAGAGWQNIAFAVSPADLLASIGTVDGALAGADTLRLFHNPDAAFGGPGAAIPVVTALLGVDNITAVAAVPEPSSLLLLALGAIAMAGIRTRGPVRRAA